MLLLKCVQHSTIQSIIHKLDDGVLDRIFSSSLSLFAGFCAFLTNASTQLVPVCLILDI